jgi:chitin disaccharide deacetylase
MSRTLLITADDFGIGPETSRGILDLAARGIVTSTVLLVNSPYAEWAVRTWHALGRPIELGWHPCLTLDRPLLPPEQVPSLVTADGRFQSLGSLLKKVVRGQLVAAEVDAELRAQLMQFVRWVGHPPTNVNGHHHIHIFPPIRDVLLRMLCELPYRPFVRRVGESWWTLLSVRGARVKRFVLDRVGRRSTQVQSELGFPGGEQLIGITDPQFVRDERFLQRWVRRASGEFVELTCHPGFRDTTLLGRDATETDGHLERRVNEWDRLRDERFLKMVQQQGWQLIPAGREPRWERLAA